MARAHPIFDARGTLQLVVGIWTDVTGFQRTREALTRESALLRALNEASQDGVLMVSPEARVLFFNQRFLDVTRPPFHLTAQSEDAPLLAAVASKMRDPEAFVARVKSIYAAPLSTSRDEVFRRDGRTIDRYSAPVQGPTGEIYGRVWFFRDITEHKLAKERERLLLQEQAARAEAEKQRRDWEFLAEAGNRMGGSLDTNRLVSTLLQLSLDRLAPCAIIDLASGDGALRRVAAAHAEPSHAKLVERIRAIEPDAEAPTGAAGTMRSGRSRLVDLEATSEGSMTWSPLGERGSGSLELLCTLGGRWLLTVPLQAREHRLGALSLVRPHPFEPSERLLAEEVASRAAMALESALLYRGAQAAIGMRDDFLSVASHELRTPITALRLALQALARMAPSLPEAASKLVRAAERYELRLSKLIDTLLDVTRLEGRKLALELEEVDLSAVAAEVVQLFSAEAQHAGSRGHAAHARAGRRRVGSLAAGADRGQPALQRHQVRQAPAGGARGERHAGPRAARGARPRHRRAHRPARGHLRALRARGLVAELRGAGAWAVHRPRHRRARSAATSSWRARPAWARCSRWICRAPPSSPCASDSRIGRGHVGGGVGHARRAEVLGVADGRAVEPGRAAVVILVVDGRRAQAPAPGGQHVVAHE